MLASARNEANRRLLRARDAMDRSYADALDIESLAGSVHLSRAHFIRSFRETFGETPHRYLQRRRIERAMSLLRETDTPVTEICLDVGFTQPRHVQPHVPGDRRQLAHRIPSASAGRAAGRDTGRSARLHGRDLGSAIEHFRRRHARPPRLA